MIISFENISQLHEVARIRRGWISDVVWSPNGRVLAVASAEGITFHSNEALKVMGKLEGHDGPVKSIAVNAGGTLLASAGADTTVRLWDLGAGGQQRVLRGHTDAVDAVAISDEGSGWHRRVQTKPFACGTLKLVNRLRCFRVIRMK